MEHSQSMLGQLPPLYREGQLIQDLLALLGLQFSILDEESQGIQRSHYFDTALELAELVKLAALIGIEPQYLQKDEEFKACVNELRNAFLEKGAVTPEALQQFITNYLKAFQKIVGLELFQSFTEWQVVSEPGKAAFIEFPVRHHYRQFPSEGGIEPLYQFSIIQSHPGETVTEFLLVGLPGKQEAIPCIANLTSHQALVYNGVIPPTARLWITSNQEKYAQAFLNGEDVSSKLYSISDFCPGKQWNIDQREKPAKSLVLKHGNNKLWFFPLAHYDSQGLDRFVLGFPDTTMRQARFDQSCYSQALLYQEPALLFWMNWRQAESGSFEIQLPGEFLPHPPDKISEIEQSRVKLVASLNEAVQLLKGAGIAGTVRARSLEERQLQKDRLVQTLPLTFREAGATGADNLTHLFKHPA